MSPRTYLPTYYAMDVLTGALQAAAALEAVVQPCFGPNGIILACFGIDFFLHLMHISNFNDTLYLIQGSMHCWRVQTAMLHAPIVVCSYSAPSDSHIQ